MRRGSPIASIAAALGVALGAACSGACGSRARAEASAAPVADRPVRGRGFGPDRGGRAALCPAVSALVGRGREAPVVRLPPGTAVDGSRPEGWVFPAGTRFWKEFSFGRRVETRFLEKQADGSWTYASYIWGEMG